MLAINQIFKVENRKLRIIWSNPKIVFWIDIESEKAWPESFEYSILEEMIINKEISQEDDPYLSSTLVNVKKNSKNEIIRDNAMSIIEKEISNPKIYCSKERGAAVQRMCKNHGVTHQTVNRNLRKYWQRGMCLNALLPDFKNSGNHGIEKDPSSNKLGRPRDIKKGIGSNTNEDIKRIFRIVILSILLNKKQKCTITEAHHSALFLIENTYPQYQKTELPTFDQFRYFYRKEYSLVEIIKEQNTTIDYQKDIKPLLSTSTTESIGPGYRFQIDATIADIYLVSNQDRKRIVGRPVIYFIVDVFSRMFAGVYVGFENPSWVAAMNAIANTAENKVEFCKKYGIEINEDEWPIEGLPNTLLADKGEFLGATVEGIASAYGIRIENASARRGDAKGIVERCFRTTQVNFKSFAPGIVEPIISKKRGVGDYREDAKLTVDDFTKIILHLVLWNNNNKVIRNYDRCEGLPTNIPDTPIHLWNWGISNLTGRIRAVDFQLLKINLMPKKEVATSDLGINLFGCYYTCKEAIDNGWFHRKVGKRPKKTIVSYDPRNTNRIYLRPTDNLNDYWLCKLSDRSRRFANITFKEVSLKLKEERITNTSANLNASISHGKTIHDIVSIINDAKKKQPNKIKVKSKGGSQNIRENKLKERDLERQKINSEQNLNKNSDSENEPPSSTHNEYAYPSNVDMLSNGDNNE